MINLNKPIVIELDGTQGMLPNGGIINAGGTSNNTFTVNGRGLLFDDGTSTSGSNIGQSATLQTVYNNSVNVSGSAGITLSVGKDFAIKDPYADGNYFSISAADGTVHINGNLIVTGSTTTVNTVVTEGNSIKLSPSSNTVSPLVIQPDLGVNPIVDLVTIRRTFGGLPVFRIDAQGNMISIKDLTISGNINGISLTNLAQSVSNHASGVPGYQHPATDVLITPIQNVPAATNVQQALEYVASHMTGGNNSTGNVYGYTHTQVAPSTLWTISHMGHTVHAQVTIYDSQYEQIIPSKVHIIDINTIQVSFTSPQDGIAIVIMF